MPLFAAPDGSVKIVFTGLGSIVCACLTVRNFKKYWVKASEETPPAKAGKPPKNPKRKDRKEEADNKQPKEKKRKASKGAK